MLNCLVLYFNAMQCNVWKTVCALSLFHCLKCSTMPYKRHYNTQKCNWIEDWRRIREGTLFLEHFLSCTFFGTFSCDAILYRCNASQANRRSVENWRRKPVYGTSVWVWVHFWWIFMQCKGRQYKAQECYEREARWRIGEGSLGNSNWWPDLARPGVHQKWISNQLVSLLWKISLFVFFIIIHMSIVVSHWV